MQSQPRPGLRARKKERTRDAIVAAAFALFQERGYAATTVAEIAELADIAPRTVAGYFPHKEDILFSPYDVLAEQIETQLEHRAPGVTVLDAVRTFVLESFLDSEHAARRAEMVAIVDRDPMLAGHDRARLARFEALFAEELARELGRRPGDVRARAAAAALIAAIDTVIRHTHRPGNRATRAGIRAFVDDVLGFVDAGLGTLRRPSA